MVGLLDQLMFGLGGARGGWAGVPIPGRNEPTEEELAAAALPALIGSQPRMGVTGGMLTPGPVGSLTGMNPFANGAQPLFGLSAGEPLSMVGPEKPKFGDPAVTSLDGGGPVPLPRPDPRRGIDASSRNIAAQEAGAPLSLAPPGGGGQMTPPSAPTGGGGFNLMDALPSSSMLLALASGFAGAPSFGAGMRRAFGNAAPIKAQQEQLEAAQGLQSRSQADVYRALIAKGVAPQEAIAALRDKNVMGAITKRLYGDADKAPAGYRRKPDGTLEFIPGGPADPVVKRELGERQNAPPGYRWRDPANPEAGLVAIPGGPAEKVDAQVAARVGMGQSFLDQLPSIRKDLSKGEATGPWDALQAKLGTGRAGELRRQIDSGAEALLRNLTGAGMNMTEAADYANRYKLQPWDTVATITSKMNQLERELQYVMTAVSKGRGGAPTVVNGKLIIGDTEAPSSTAATRTRKTKSGITYEVEE